ISLDDSGQRLRREIWLNFLLFWGCLHTMDLSPPPLVNYVLTHMSVKTNVCSFQKHERGYVLPSRTVPDYNLIFVTRGRVVWVVAGVQYPLVDGGLVIVPPAVEHHAFCNTQRITLVSTHVEATLPGGQDVFQLLVPPRFQQVARDCPFD